MRSLDRRISLATTHKRPLLTPNWDRPGIIPEAIRTARQLVRKNPEIPRKNPETLRNNPETARKNSESLWKNRETLRKYPETVWKCPETPRKNPETYWKNPETLRIPTIPLELAMELVMALRRAKVKLPQTRSHPETATLIKETVDLVIVRTREVRIKRRRKIRNSLARIAMLQVVRTRRRQHRNHLQLQARYDWQSAFHVNVKRA